MTCVIGAGAIMRRMIEKRRRGMTYKIRSGTVRGRIIEILNTGSQPGAGSHIGMDAGKWRELAELAKKAVYAEAIPLLRRSGLEDREELARGMDNFWHGLNAAMETLRERRDGDFVSFGRGAAVDIAVMASFALFGEDPQFVWQCLPVYNRAMAGPGQNAAEISRSE